MKYKLIIISLLLLLLLCSNKNNVVCIDEYGWMCIIMEHHKACGYNTNNINKMIRKQVPSQYFVRIKKIPAGWHYYCTDTSTDYGKCAVREMLRAE